MSSRAPLFALHLKHSACQVCQIVVTRVLPRDDVINFNGPFICRNTAQFAAKPGALKNVVAKAS